MSQQYSPSGFSLLPPVVKNLLIINGLFFLATMSFETAFGIDLVIVRAGVGAAPGDYRFDILEPHNPSLADNFEKAKGLAKFAGTHGHLFHRIQLIRKKPSAGSGTLLRLDLNSEAVRHAVLLVTANPQLDAVFDEYAKG